MSEAAERLGEPQALGSTLHTDSFEKAPRVYYEKPSDLKRKAAIRVTYPTGSAAVFPQEV